MIVNYLLGFVLLLLLIISLWSMKRYTDKLREIGLI